MRKNEFHRTADFHRAKTPKERLYYSGGIPSSNWKDFEGNPIFQPLNIAKNNISEKSQKDWFFKLYEDQSHFLQPYLIIIGSTDNDKLACDLSFELMKKALCSIKKRDDVHENHKYHRVQITDAALIKEEEVRDENIFMLLNVFSECNIDRIQNIRDWVFRHREYYKIIAMMGNPYNFSKKCGLTPNILLYVEDASNFISM